MPVLAAADRDRLAAALDRAGVVAASLVGSQARGDAGPPSDVDVAIWLDRGLDADGRAALRDVLLAAASAALARDDIDVILLDDAPPLVRHRAMRDGATLVERDADERVRRETAALLEYLDTAPLRELRARTLERRLAEDRFGRP